MNVTNKLQLHTYTNLLYCFSLNLHGNGFIVRVFSPNKHLQPSRCQIVSGQFISLAPRHSLNHTWTEWPLTLIGTVTSPQLRANLVHISLLSPNHLLENRQDYSLIPLSMKPSLPTEESRYRILNVSDVFRTCICWLGWTFCESKKQQ